MAFLSTLNIIGSGMTAQQLRMDVIAENITNINTTRTEAGGAYRRKVVVMEAQGDKDDFREALQRVRLRQERARLDRRSAQTGERQIVFGGGYDSLVLRDRSNRGYETAGGVRVTEILEDDTEMPFVYDPTHPDANEAGYVEMPNITLVKEITDAMAASQAFSADVTAFNTFKQIVSSGMDISV
ncbi:MAG: flagellar basal body rod protein FlgC [Oscillospiraceae bacterium]|nr:flagellar basal body rod protein FlgC [Oscillospiraceae bacterium]